MSTKVLLNQEQHGEDQDEMLIGEQQQHRYPTRQTGTSTLWKIHQTLNKYGGVFSKKGELCNMYIALRMRIDMMIFGFCPFRCTFSTQRVSVVTQLQRKTCYTCSLCCCNVACFVGRFMG